MDEMKHNSFFNKEGRILKKHNLLMNHSISKFIYQLVAVVLFLAFNLLTNPSLTAQKAYTISSGNNYLAHRYNTTSHGYELYTTRVFSDSCVWYSPNTNNYYFMSIDGSTRYYLSAAFATTTTADGAYATNSAYGAGALLTIRAEDAEVTALLGSNTSNYYFYNWDWGLAHGQQYEGGSCPSEFNSEGSECWRAYWLVYDNALGGSEPQWHMSTTSSYEAVEHIATFEPVRIIHHDVDISTQTGGLSAISGGAITYGGSINPVATIGAYSDQITPEYTSLATGFLDNCRGDWTVRVCDTIWTTHNFYPSMSYTNDHGTAVPPSSEHNYTAGEVTSYSWTLSGAGTAYLTLSGENTNAPTVTYSTPCHAAGGSTATLMLTVTWPDGSMQTQTVEIIVDQYLYPPTSFSVNPTDIELVEDGEPLDLTFVFTPTENVDTEVDIVASVPGIVSVTGRSVEPLAVGTTTLTITPVSSPELAVAVAVTVRPKAPTITFAHPAGSNLVNAIIAATTSAASPVQYYTTDGSVATNAGTPYSAPFNVANGTEIHAVTVVTVGGTQISSLETVVVNPHTDGDGSSAGSPYTVMSVADLNYINSSNANRAKYYKVVGDFDASLFTTSITNFSGTFDGDFHVISNLTHPLFATTTGTVLNVTLKDVNIAVSGNNHCGAIAATASGDARIYNCGVLSGTIAGSTTNDYYTGSIVGRLGTQNTHTARVLNCYSFADLTGNYVGGIVGYNHYASQSGTLRTLVLNCMFYGTIDATNSYPIYGGSAISNVYTGATNTGINNYNYFLTDRIVSTITDYNCALEVEPRLLNRYEFYRHILNSQRKLTGFYIGGAVSDANSALVAKWVLDTTIASYPILKPWGRYTSPVNRYMLKTSTLTTDAPAVSYQPTIDYNDPAARAAGEATRYVGAQMGTLTVNAKGGTTNGALNTTKTLTLYITDMDTAHYDYCFRKVQLPYYNDLFGTATNYGAKVCTGWKITAVNGNSNPSTTFTTTGDTRYNFADTTDLGKDVYSISRRVFAQGGYYYVPQGVTSIDIEAYWGNAYYLSDPNYDRTSSVSGNVNAALNEFTIAGTCPTTFNDQTVRTSYADARNQVASSTSTTVYDNAIVLVGNVHFRTDNDMNNDTRSFTIMSVDLDVDCEPDYCFFFQTKDRIYIDAVRWDFLCVPGIGNAAKPSTARNVATPGILKPKGWFEITETGLIRFNQFEYEAKNKNNNSPVIFNGGMIDQFVTFNDDAGTRTTHTPYMIFGGNVWFKEFQNGVHADKNVGTNHCPVSVMGGDFDKFYLSGTFRPDAGVFADNVILYANGGNFGELAGAGQEQVNGNVIVSLNHSVVDYMYGGGINKAKPVLGDISVTINNSLVTQIYCGGPKFGNVQAGKTVTTNATGTVFRKYFGAGNGGTSLYRHRFNNSYDRETYNWSNFYNNYQRGNYVSGRGVAVSYEFELFARSGAWTVANVGRFYVHYASFDKAQTKNVTSTLSRCVVLDDYYGGGNLGEVDGNATSTLTDCTVFGSVFGGGFSAAIPEVTVYPASRDTQDPQWPSFNTSSGFYSLPDLPPTDAETYVWSNSGSTSAELNATNKTIYTSETLTGLGSVKYNTYLTIDGSLSVGGHTLSHVYGSVYGGGNESAVCTNNSNSTNVLVKGNSLVDSHVFGGGNAAVVGASGSANTTNVTLREQCKVQGNIYGGGNAGEVFGSTNVTVGD